MTLFQVYFKELKLIVVLRSLPWNRQGLFFHMSPVDWAGRLGSYEKFQPGLRDEKRPKTSCGAKFEKQSKHGETRYITWRNKVISFGFHMTLLKFKLQNFRSY